MKTLSVKNLLRIKGLINCNMSAYNDRTVFMFIFVCLFECLMYELFLDSQNKRLDMEHVQSLQILLSGLVAKWYLGIRHHMERFVFVCINILPSHRQSVAITCTL